MNERIRQLADEAGLRFTQLMSNPMVPVVDGKETDLAKFAELIVRECVNICETKRAEYTKLCKDADNFTDKNLYAEGEISAHRIRISIQEHFGVEL